MRIAKSSTRFHWPEKKLFKIELLLWEFHSEIINCNFSLLGWFFKKKYESWGEEKQFDGKSYDRKTQFEYQCNVQSHFEKEIFEAIVQSIFEKDEIQLSRYF